MTRFLTRISFIVCLLTVTASAGEVYTYNCEHCDYTDEDLLLGITDDAKTISPGLCPGCNELIEVVLKKGDSDGSKNYKCPSCKEKVYLYRNPEGHPLTEPEPGEKYQCPRCGSYGLVFEKKAADEEAEGEEICPEESGSSE